MKFQIENSTSTDFTGAGGFSQAARCACRALILATIVAMTLCGNKDIFAQGLIWVQTENPGLSDAAMAVALHGSGLYVAGIDDHCCLLHGERWRIEKRSPIDGSIVWTRTSDPSIGVDHPRGIAVDDRADGQDALIYPVAEILR